MRVGFKDITPLRLEGESDVVLQDVTVESGSWRRHVGYAELFTRRDEQFWSEATAVARAKDEVLAALIDIQEAERRNLSIAEYLPELKSKLVLVLGDFSSKGRARLTDIHAELASRGYVGILLDEVPDLPGQDLVAKATTVGALARFIVVDDSSAAGHLAEVPIAVMNRWIVLLLRLDGTTSSWVTRGLSAASRLVYEATYSRASLPTAIGEATAWAEMRLAELDRHLDETYPWRKPAPEDV